MKGDNYYFNFCDFVFREIEPDDIEKFYRLRHQIFCKDLNWLPINEQEIEKDSYDNLNISKNFGAFTQSEELIGGVRLVLPSNKGFMLENEFRDLIDDNFIPKKNSLEVTRLGVDKRFKNPNGAKIALGLYKIFNIWCLENSFQFYYFVAEKKYIRSLQSLNFFVEKIGNPKLKHNVTHAALIDVQKTSEQIKSKDKQFHEWMGFSKFYP
jgi:N-acyl-L-homoserine lactone synthetase